MGLPTDILNYFYYSNVGDNSDKHNRSVFSFCQETNNDLNEVRRICRRLEDGGFMLLVGRSQDSIYEYYVSFQIDQRLAKCGYYDFFVYGFLSIRNHYINSVRPIIVSHEDEEDIGTCFVITENCIATAWHCIENKSIIKITDQGGNILKPQNIWKNIDNNKDVAIVQFQDVPFNDIPPFRFDKGYTLDPILTMGYPPISGFDAIQISELAAINTVMKVSKGNIIGQDQSYLDKQEYILINARVKGGNSGGPIINKFGLVVGMLVTIPLDPIKNNELDKLGYGLAIPADEIIQLADLIDSNSTEAKNIEFINFDEGFSTAKR